MAREIQLDIFEEAQKEIDSTATKIKQENESYEKKRTEIQKDIISTERALKEEELSWQDRSEYEKDLQEYQRDLASLEKMHQKIIAGLSENQKS